MMATGFKAPPVWSDDKSEVDMWLIITELAKEKQALALTLSLNGRKREVAREVPLAELNSNDGVTKLKDKLKSSFATNEVDLSYEAFVN